MIRRPPRSTQSRSSAASDVYKRQVVASGAGAEMRQAMGIAVFSGMIGVTLFGLFLTPVFYVTLMKLGAKKKAAPTTERKSILPGASTATVGIITAALLLSFASVQAGVLTVGPDYKALS